MATYDDKQPGAEQTALGTSSQPRGLGKHTIVSAIPVQQRASSSAEVTTGDAATQDKASSSWIQCFGRDQPANAPETLHAAAAQGVATPASPLPHGAAIQRSFGHHDVSGIQAHTGPAAAGSARAMGADAYATGNHVVLGGRTDLHTVAHEAAHVVQQRGGVQLKGGVGAAGDAYEQHADAVADAVVAGKSAAPLLDRIAGRGATHEIQRKEGEDDAKILENQASLKGPDVEIPALEGALLTTRVEAVKQGLLSQASFDAGLKLSQAMTRLQPATVVKPGVQVDFLLQETAAIAAHQLFAALRAETADDKNFKPMPSLGGDLAVLSQNPYTEEKRVTTPFTQATRSSLEQLPALIRQGKWEDAFSGYRRMLDGLDLWVADQLRKKGKGTPEEARGNAHQHNSQLRTGLEQIAGKHAKRIPALFHPDADTRAKEKAAGRPVADAIPMNVYFWKDDDGKHHLYDLTTPSRPHEQTIDGPPTAAMMNTFVEEVARYPEGNVRYTLPDGSSGVGATTGKTKWYEWVGYAGLAVAAVGLAFLTAGASVPTTVCFAAGALAGGVSAAGHLGDTLHLGTATTATVVLDVAQIVASFASAGAMNITLKAGGAAAGLASSRWFVPLVGAAASADVVQLVALTDITFVELSRIQSGAGTPEDKQRAMSVLLTQLLVMSGMTALSVKGARDARALGGQSLELVEQNGAKTLRVVGENTSAPAGESAAIAGDAHKPTADLAARPAAPDGHGPAPTDRHGPKGGAHTDEKTSAPAGESAAVAGDTHRAATDLPAKPVDTDGHGPAPTDHHGPKGGTHTDEKTSAPAGESAAVAGDAHRAATDLPAKPADTGGHGPAPTDHHGPKGGIHTDEKTSATAGKSAAVTGDTHRAATDLPAKPADTESHGPAPTDHHGPKGGTHTDASGTPERSTAPDHWLAELEHSLEPAEQAKLAQMKSGKTPQEVQKMFGGDLDAARERVRAAVGADQERAATAVQSKERVADLRKQIADRALMNDPEVRAIVERPTKSPNERLPKLRDKLIAKVLRAEAEHAHPGAEVLDGVKIYEKLPEADLAEWRNNNPRKRADGLIERDDGLFAQRGEIDMMVIERQPSGKAKVIAREEIKTGMLDSNADARGQLNDQSTLFRDGAAGKKSIRLEVGERDITAQIDLGSDSPINTTTRGPAGKGFDQSLGVSANDLEKMCKDLLAEASAAGKQSP